VKRVHERARLVRFRSGDQRVQDGQQLVSTSWLARIVDM
jgi:hypothetical protein